MNQKQLLVFVAAAGLLCVGPVFSRRNGILPTSSRPLTRNANASCGDCHNRSPGGAEVAVTPSLRVLDPSQSIQVRVAGTGGPPGNAGGFALDTTAGTLVAGANTRTAASARAITHSNPNNRSWTFGFVAPPTPGLVELFSVVNTVDGNGKESGDNWAFHGATPTATISTPVRMYVNAPGVAAIGTGCSDGYGNVAVFGARETPSVGNGNFGFEAFGLPPSARMMLMLGLQRTMASIDLTIAGAPGCWLHTDIVVSAMRTTSGGDAARAEGTFTLRAPIPNDPTLKGFYFRTQVAAIDGSPNARAFPVVFTNGLGITIQ